AHRARGGLMLDLLLIAEEAHSAEFSKYNRHFLHVFADLFRLLRCNADDAKAVRDKFGLETYLVDMSDRRLFGASDHQVEYAPILPHRPSLALCDLATVAKAAGYEVAVVDNVVRYPFRREQMRRLLETEKPRLVGISTTLLLYPQVVTELVAEVRERAPQAK